MNKIVIWLLMIVGGILIFISLFSIYLWYLPLGLVLDAIGGYMYVKEKRRKIMEKAKSSGLSSF